MSKKAKYSVMFHLPASTHLVFEGPVGMTDNEVEHYLNENNLWPSPSVCHQCSDNVQIDDYPDEIIEIYSAEGGGEGE